MTSNFGYVITWINVTPHFMVQLLLSVEQLWSCSFVAAVLLCKIWFYHVWELSKFILCNFEKFRCSLSQWPKGYKSWNIIFHSTHFTLIYSHIMLQLTLIEKLKRCFSVKLRKNTIYILLTYYIVLVMKSTSQFDAKEEKIWKWHRLEFQIFQFHF